jgi:DNA/RNA-binding domain of Phe-tRNA-synthetase-like protein
MSFSVSDACLQLGLRAGAIIFRNVRVTAAGPDLRTEIAREVELIRASYPGLQAIRSIPEVAGFRELLWRVHVSPRKEPPSIERLLTFILKRRDLPAINNLVDAYNLVSVRTMCSLGAHDLDRIALPLELRLLTGREMFTPLRRSIATPVVAGEYGYVDARDRVLCRLDLLQAEFSKVTEATTNALVIVEGTKVHTLDALGEAFAETIGVLTRYCGGTAEMVAIPHN